MYPSCGSVRPKRTTRIDEPPSNQPDLSDDITILWFWQSAPEPKHERRAPQPDGDCEVPFAGTWWAATPPDDPRTSTDLMSYLLLPRRSGRVRRHLTRPDNVMVINTLRKLLKTLSGLAIGSRLVGSARYSRQHLRRNQLVSVMFLSQTMLNSNSPEWYLSTLRTK